MGNNIGIIIFPSISEVTNALKNSDGIVSFQLKVTREAIGGLSSSQNLHLWTHGYSSFPHSKPNLMTSLGDANTFAWGSSKWIHLSSTAIKSFENGAKGFAFYSPSGSDYSIYNSSVTLKLNYYPNN